MTEAARGNLPLRSADGPGWNAERYALNAAFVPELGAPLLHLLAVQPGERVLDLGCGEGALTARLAAAGALVLGIDASAEMVAAARARGLEAQCLDARALPFISEFDAVLSNASLHWMGALPAVLARVYQALRPGGQFVGELGAEGNVAAVRVALAEALAVRGIDASTCDPWVFPSSDAFRRMLRLAGFRIGYLTTFDRPTSLTGDLSGWLETFAPAFLAAVSHSQRQDVVADVCARLRPRLCRPDGVWVVDYVRLRFAAIRPAVDAPG